MMSERLTQKIKEEIEAKTYNLHLKSLTYCLNKIADQHHLIICNDRAKLAKQVFDYFNVPARIYYGKVRSAAKGVTLPIFAYFTHIWIELDDYILETRPEAVYAVNKAYLLLKKEEVKYLHPTGENYEEVYEKYRELDIGDIGANIPNEYVKEVILCQPSEISG